MQAQEGAQQQEEDIVRPESSFIFLFTFTLYQKQAVISY